jgi:hypothetical protein
MSQDVTKKVTINNSKHMEVIQMSKVSEFLTANPVQYLATVSLDGKAKCRPFMFSFEKD